MNNDKKGRLFLGKLVRSFLELKDFELLSDLIEYEGGVDSIFDKFIESVGGTISGDDSFEKAYQVFIEAVSFNYLSQKYNPAIVTDSLRQVTKDGRMEVLRSKCDIPAALVEDFLQSHDNVHAGNVERLFDGYFDRLIGGQM